MKKPDPPAIIQAEEYFNVSYGTDPAQKLDLYLPAERTPETKLLTIVHGGTWSFGDKSDLNAYVQLAKTYLPEYAIANINYRLINETGNKFPVQEEDINSAIQFLYERVNNYRLSDKFVYLGESAGAHLSLLQAYKNTQTVRPVAVIDFYGPTDLKAMYDSAFNIFTRETLEFILQGTPETKPDEYAASSPLTYVNSTSCPTLIFHGGNDLLVDVHQSLLLHNRLNELDVVNKYIFYPEEGHRWFGEKLKQSFISIKEFLDENVE
jgi:acetyl esterase/lipase